MTELDLLPGDLLNTLCGYLRTRHIYQLYSTGSLRMRRNISQNLDSLILDNDEQREPYSVAYMVTKLSNLRNLVIGGTPSQAVAWPCLLAVGSNQVRTLRLCGRNIYQIWYTTLPRAGFNHSLTRSTIGDLFPALESLKLKTSTAPEDDHFETLVASLPSTLTHLCIGAVSERAARVLAAHMPPHLTSLKLLAQDAWRTFLLPALPRCLVKLHYKETLELLPRAQMLICQSSTSEAYQQLPTTLESFTTNSALSASDIENLPRSLKVLHAPSLWAPGFEDDDDFDTLMLGALGFGPKAPQKPKFKFPPSLQQLSLSTAPTLLFSEVISGISSLNLTLLHVGGVAFPPRCLPSLPKMILDLKMVIRLQTVFTSSTLVFPSRLTSLVINVLEVDTVDVLLQLPDTLTHLTVSSTCSWTDQHIAALPRQIRHLSLRACLCLTDSCIPMLPPQIQTFHSCSSFSEEITRHLPPLLTTLSMSTLEFSPGHHTLEYIASVKAKLPARFTGSIAATIASEGKQQISPKM